MGDEVYFMDFKHWHISCHECGELMGWHNLLVEGGEEGEMGWYLYCDNRRCERGPRVIRSLEPFEVEPRG